ncbi:MAG: N-acetyl-gamma-glutamyl-phosphate reductase [Candidatus Omnitrophota bacterium]|nr:MAG: N-acetyl-gamma-glutamyl-phosphate reductase [Candidatus Omnitrophota bacterium]
MNIKVGIIGATGHTGEELIGILLGHPYVSICGLYNTGKDPQVISQVFPKFKGRLDRVCKKADFKEIADKCDLIFLALPHTVSMDFTPKLLKINKKIIDLSADYRIKNTRVFEKFYGKKHKDNLGLRKAVYGLPEIYRNKIKHAKLVANPGCYPTAAILALAPLVSLGLVDNSSIIIDAKSGVSGAGKKLTKEFLFSEVAGNFSAYKVNTHQHMPEIELYLSRLASSKVKIKFVPHLLPINRGIIETIYVNKSHAAKGKNILGIFKSFYKNEPFIRIKEEGKFPKVSDVYETNYCDIGIKDCGDSVIIIAAIDNLSKGASGQAVQNMNIMYKIPETTGLL